MKASGTDTINSYHIKHFQVKLDKYKGHVCIIVNFGLQVRKDRRKLQVSFFIWNDLDNESSWYLFQSAGRHVSEIL